MPSFRSQFPFLVLIPIAVLGIVGGSFLFFRHETANQSLAVSKPATQSPSAQPQTNLANVVTKDDLSALDSSQLKSAFQLIDKGRWQLAEPVLLSLLGRHPSNHPVLNELMILNQSDKRDYLQAMKFCETLLKTHPEVLFIFDKYLELSQLSGSSERALAYLDSLSGDYRIAFTQARILHGLKEEDRAIAKYGDALAEANEDQKGMILESLALSFAVSGKSKEAADAYEAALLAYREYNDAHTPSNPMDRKDTLAAERSLLPLYLQTEQIEKARVLLEKLLATDSQNKQLLVYKKQMAALNRSY